MSPRVPCLRTSLCNHMTQPGLKSAPAGSLPRLMEVCDEEESDLAEAPASIPLHKNPHASNKATKKKASAPKTLAKEPRRQATRRGAQQELESELEAATWASLAEQGNSKPGRHVPTNTESPDPNLKPNPQIQTTRPLDPTEKLT